MFECDKINLQLEVVARSFVVSRQLFTWNIYLGLCSNDRLLAAKLFQVSFKMTSIDVCLIQFHCPGSSRTAAR